MLYPLYFSTTQLDRPLKPNVKFFLLKEVHHKVDDFLCPFVIHQHYTHLFYFLVANVLQKEDQNKTNPYFLNREELKVCS